MNSDNNYYDTESKKAEVDTKKVYAIDAVLTLCNKTSEENYCIIQEINDSLFGNPHPDAKEGILAQAETSGWFDKVLLYVNDLRHKNEDIQLQLKKLHKEVCS